MMTNEAIANQLKSVYQTKITCAPIADLMESKTMQTAYDIQEINTQKWISEGRKVVGCKIGLTSPAVQKQLGVDQPDFGILYDDMIYLDGQEVDTSKLIQPKAEAEIAIVLKSDLKKEQNTIEDIVEAADYATPALEIVDSRIADWKISIYDTIADNASSALYAIGKQRISINQVDWEGCEMKMYNHSELVSQGKGSDCMGNPLIAAAWLADKMVEQKRPLKAGDIILTGALGPMFTIQDGEKITTEISSVGKLTITFKKKSNA